MERLDRIKIKERRRRVNIILKSLKKLFPKETKTALNYSNPFELLVAVMLSAQCTDKQVNKVTKYLFKKYKTIDDYINADIKEFEEDIKSIGFYKNKAKNILLCAKMIKEKYGGEVPKTINEMVKLPGVGRKTANVVLGNAFGIVEGIAVDTHVKRLSLFFGLTDNNNPDKIEADLMEIVPKKEWFNFSNLIIEYGRKYHSARKRDVYDLPITKALLKAGHKITITN